MAAEQQPGIAKPASYYDAEMGRVLVPLEDSPWLEVYCMAMALLPPPVECDTVVDLGCGTGRFARLLADNGYRHYLGIDFSSARVEEARRYVPEYRFEVADLSMPRTGREVSAHRTFVLLEVLEHIEDDIGLLASLPSGSLVVMSVPNYDSRGHVRHFASVDEVRTRYDGVLDFSGGRARCRRNLKKERMRIFLLEGHRR